MANHEEGRDGRIMSREPVAATAASRRIASHGASGISSGCPGSFAARKVYPDWRPLPPRFPKPRSLSGAFRRRNRNRERHCRRRRRIHSIVRDSLFGSEAPRFTGCLRYRGLVRQRCSSSIDSKNVTLWVGPHRHIVHYPVKRGDLLNVVAITTAMRGPRNCGLVKCERSEVAAIYHQWHEFCGN